VKAIWEAIEETRRERQEEGQGAKKVGR